MNKDGKPNCHKCGDIIQDVKPLYYEGEPTCTICAEDYYGENFNKKDDYKR